VWIALHELLGRLRARVGNALNNFEHDLTFDEPLVRELKADVDSFTRLAATLHRRSQP
jgi:hypothetical protein